MPRFRKKPLEIDAVQMPSPEDVDETTFAMAPQWIIHALGTGIILPAGEGWHVITLEDGADKRVKHIADPGDWIIRGIAGELYPCKPKIFEATYERVSA